MAAADVEVRAVRALWAGAGRDVPVLWARGWWGVAWPACVGYERTHAQIQGEGGSKWRIGG
jgi:hypothetical protein